ncbi:MAG: hypothetical protein QXQ90_09795 [Desulfurococcaceae archaeon]
MSEVVHAVSVSEAIVRTVTTPVVYKDNEGRVVVEIPLKPESRLVTLKLPEEVVYAIDKVVAVTATRGNEEVTRSLLMRRILEALAFSFAQLDYIVDEVEVTCRNREKKVTIAIKLTPKPRVNTG